MFAVDLELSLHVQQPVRFLEEENMSHGILSLWAWHNVVTQSILIVLIMIIIAIIIAIISYHSINLIKFRSVFETTSHLAFQGQNYLEANTFQLALKQKNGYASSVLP